MRLRTALLMTLAASGIYALQACAEGVEEPTDSASSEIRNDGKQPNGTNPGKLSCEDQAGLIGADTVVDLGGVNRTLDLGGGQSVVISGVKKGKEWRFDFEATIPISVVLMRSGNKDSMTDITPPSTTGSVTRADAEGETKPGLNRIAFCFAPPPPPDGGPPPPDGGPPPPPDAGSDGGRTW